MSLAVLPEATDASIVRATLIEGEFGSVDHHLRRYETLSLDTAA